MSFSLRTTTTTTTTTTTRQLLRQLLHNSNTRCNYITVLSRIQFPFIKQKQQINQTMYISNKSDRALMDELHRLSNRQENSQPTLGPFMMPRGKVDEKPLRVEELHPWSLVGWSERFRRLFRMARNLIIVSFGGCLGLLVIYSITSELFAPSSTTNLMNMTITTLEESERLKKILKAPYKYHTSTIPSQTIQNQTGNIELRFKVESYKANHAIIQGDWKTLEWWKSWITPLMTSQVFSPSNSNLNNLNQNQSSQSHLDPNSNNQLDSSESTRLSNSWWPGFLKILMPNTLGIKSSLSHNDQRSWSDRLFSNHGPFDQGEVIAELIKESNGQWKYKTLVIEFPDSISVKYRLNVADELRKKQQKNLINKNKNQHGIVESSGHDGDGEKQHTRYRFWDRRINL